VSYFVKNVKYFFFPFNTKIIIFNRKQLLFSLIFPERNNVFEQYIIIKVLDEPERILEEVNVVFRLDISFIFGAFLDSTSPLFFGARGTRHSSNTLQLTRRPALSSVCAPHLPYIAAMTKIKRTISNTNILVTDRSTNSKE